MKIRNLALATAAISLAVTPAIAQVALDRSSAPVDGESEIAGSAGILAALLGGAAIIGGIVALSGDDDPASP